MARPLVRATFKRLAREYWKPRKQARELTSDALAAVKATTRIRRVDRGKRRRRETEAVANRRALVDLALLQVMRDGLLRRSEAGAFRWGDLEYHADGCGRLHVLRSNIDQTAEGAVLNLGPAAVDTLLAIRPEEAMIDPSASAFGLSVSQIYHRVKTATKMTGLDEGFSAHSPRVGTAQDLSAAGAELMAAGRWESPNMPAKYTEAQAAGKGAVARYYRGDLRKCPRLVSGLVFHGSVGRLVQPMTPETAEVQPLILTSDTPGSYLDTTPGWTMISHGLESRQQVIVCGHHHTDVVSALECKSYEIDGQGNIDALLLGSTLGVSQFSLDYRSPGRLPALALLSMSSEGPYVHSRVRPPRVNPHFREGVWRAVHATPGRYELTQGHGFQVPISAGLRVGEEDTACTPVGVLIVDE